MINKIEAKLGGIVAHYIGRKSEEEDVQLSNSMLDISSPELRSVLMKYFIDVFKNPEFFQFSYANDEIEFNPVYNYASNIFDDESLLLEESVKIARLLYEKSIHPNIKPGDLMVATIKDVLVDDEMVDAIAIFKSETKDAFLKLDKNNTQYDIDLDQGVNIAKPDKACLIFNTDHESGLKLVIIDHSNKNLEARFWRQDFLDVKPRNDSYHATTQYISMTKSFIKERMPHIDHAEKVDEIDILNKSKNYFENAESFEKTDYEDRVFADPSVKDSFKEYSIEYANTRNLEVQESFEINDHAVKQKARIFKSILKLDKNFHIYIHGDRSKIEKGVDSDGQKFYKIRYEEEL